MTSLLTKYRPDTFDAVIGQDAVVHALRDALKHKHGAAFMFEGPSGCGKTTLARLSAEALGCAVANIEEVDAASRAGVDDMREITNSLLYKPLGGGSKAIIVDEAHALSKQAWSALLKTIEEPPVWAFWLFCTTVPEKIPVNIRNRCLRFSVTSVGRDMLRELLERVSHKEGWKIEAAIINACVAEANGSPRQALANLAVTSRARSRAEAVSLLRSAQDSPEAVELARALMQRNWNVVQKLLGEMKENDTESVRRVVRGYMTTVALQANADKGSGAAIEILDEFNVPFDHFSALVLACGRICLR